MSDKYVSRDIWKQLPDSLPYKSSVKRILTQADTKSLLEIFVEYLKEMKQEDYECYWRDGFSHLDEYQWNWLIQNIRSMEEADEYSN